MTLPAAVYDSIDGSLYDAGRDAPIFLPERRKILQLAGDLRRRNVLDLACGSGTYTRLAKRFGAERVVGVDISAGMLSVARNREISEQLGIDYVHADVARMHKLGEFDVCFAVWLFNYARDVDDLRSMFVSVARNLAPKGRLIALTINPDFILRTEGWAGWSSSLLQRNHLGDCIEYIHDRDKARISIRQWSRRTYEDATSAAGLTQHAWHYIPVPSANLTGPRASEWQHFLRNPPMIAMSAEKVSNLTSNLLQNREQRPS